MLDLLHLAILFRPEYVLGGEGFAYLPADKAKAEGLKGEVALARLGLKMRSENAWQDEEGFWHCEDLKHPFESLPSSHTGIAFKLCHGPGFYPFISLKASPAKVLQGHNVFGGSSIKSGAFEFLGALVTTHPQLGDALDFTAIEVMQLDCTFSARLPSDRIMQATVDCLRKLSVGQTFSRESARGQKLAKGRGVCSYQRTVYFGGESSRLKTVKFYDKEWEFRDQLAEQMKKAEKGDSLAKRLVAIMTEPRLLDWSKGLLRIEASIKSRWLERRKLPTNLYDLIRHQETLQGQGRCFIRELWQQTTRDIFRAFEGHSMTIIDDDHIRDALRAKFATTTPKGNLSYAKADRVFSFYERLCDRGFQHVHSVTPQPTMWRYIRDLTAVGLCPVYLQNIDPERAASNVVSLLRLIDVRFDEQLPPWYVEPVSSFDLPGLKAA